MKLEITIKEPTTDTMLHLEAEPEDYTGEQGWRILFPEKDSFVIVEKDGQWTVADERWVNPELVDAIGSALKSHARYNSLT